MSGVVIGGFLAGFVFADPNAVQLSDATLTMLTERGLAVPTGLNPTELFSFSLDNVLVLLIGGVLIGFGTRYASGCTSGHAITGLATFQVKSLYAVFGIFSGGAFSAYFIVPFLGY